MGITIRGKISTDVLQGVGLSLGISLYTYPLVQVVALVKGKQREF